MSVEQQQQQQQLTAIELTKTSNNNNNSSSNNNNNNNNNNTASSSSNNSSLNLKTSLDANDLKHQDILLKAKDTQNISDCVATAQQQQQPKQNGQHYGFDAKETNGGDHIKCQQQQQQQQQHETDEKETQQKIRPSLKNCVVNKDQNDSDDHDHNEEEEEDNNEEACSLNTACIIKTPLNKTLLKKCTPNGNGNHSPLALTTTNTASTTSSSNTCTCTCNNTPTSDIAAVNAQDAYEAGDNDYQDCENETFDHFTKIPIPTTQQQTSSAPSTATTPAIKCTKCNNNNNIHYNNYNCYYRKKATRLKPSICR